MRNIDVTQIVASDGMSEILAFSAAARQHCCVSERSGEQSAGKPGVTGFTSAEPGITCTRYGTPVAYVPFLTSTISPACAASTASWIFVAAVAQLV